MASLALAFDILARDRGASKTLNKVGDAAENTGKRGTGMGTAIAGGLAIAAAAIAKLSSDAIGDASDLSETMNKTTVVFGKSSGSVIKWSQTAAKSLGLSQESALAFTAQFGDMFRQLGQGEKQAASTSQGVVKLATDLGSFHNLKTGDVLDKISGAMRGEYDAIQKIIPGLSDARVKQEALRASGKASATQLTEQEKAMAALAIITKDGAAANNDFAETSSGLANQQKIFSASVTDLKAKLGTALLPIMADVVAAGVKMASWATDNTGTVKVLGGAVLGLAGVLGTAKVITLGVAAAESVMAAKTVVLSGVTKAMTGAQWLLNAALTANPIGLVIALVAGLVVGLVIAYKKSDTFRAIVDKAFRAVAAAGKWMWETVLKPAFGAFGQQLKNLGIAAGFLWNNVLKPTFRFIAQAFLSLVGAIIRGAANAFGWVPGLGPKLKSAAAKFDQFRAAVNRSLDGIEDKNVNVNIKVGGDGKFAGKTGLLKAKGGSVFGPGTETSDSIPAWLSKNEHVWTAAEVRGAGGHQAVEKFRLMAKSGALPAFASGGRVLDIYGRTNGMGAAYKAAATQINRAAELNRLAALDGTGGAQRGNGKGSQASLLAFARVISRMGYNVAEGPGEFGPVHRVHSPNSRHYSGRAIDVNKGAGTSRAEQSALSKIIGLGHSYGLSSIFMSKGHYNHAHFQYDQGGWLEPGRTMVENKTGKPEAVLTHEESAGLKAGLAGGQPRRMHPLDIVAIGRAAAGVSIELDGNRVSRSVEQNVTRSLR